MGLNQGYHNPQTSSDQYSTEDPIRGGVGGSTGTCRRGRDWLPYKGEPCLVIAIDLGTTYSGASYCILTNGQVPRIEDVKTFPGQGAASSKVPSVIIYNEEGKPVLFGASAVESAQATKALDNGGAAARWWKLYLKPAHLELIFDPDSPAPDLDPLPFGIKAETVASQFLLFMASCVGQYIKTRYSNGSEILNSLAESTRYIITVPNGWELPQQQILRRACVEAGLVTEATAHTVSFVTEAEASINFCAQSSSMAENLQNPGQQLIVCDAGGGTIDISTYRVMASHPSLQVTETSASDCLIAGSTTVDRRARDMIAERLRGTEWDNPTDLLDLQMRFCTSMKESFVSREGDQYLLIGSSSLNRPELGIRRGKLILKGEDVAQLFEPSIRATAESIKARVSPQSNGQPITVAMVGGFSESAFLRNEVQARLGNLAKLCKPDEATSKAVASGAVAWLIDGVVKARVAKMTYGIRCSTQFRPNEYQHILRQDKKFSGSDGKLRLPNTFGSVMRKGEAGAEDQEHTESFSMTWQVSQKLVKDINLYVYRGEAEVEPTFLDEGGFEQLCRFQVDMEPFRQVLTPRRGVTGQPYYTMPVKLAMRLNGPEIQAQVVFEHNGQSFRSPVNVIVDDVA